MCLGCNKIRYMDDRELKIQGKPKLYLLINAIGIASQSAGNATKVKQELE